MQPNTSDQTPSTAEVQAALPPAVASSDRKLSHVNFGVELELLLSLRPTHELVDTSLTLPDSDCSASAARRYRVKMHQQIALLLSKHGLRANYYDPGDDDDPDYSAWIVTNDGSISTKHQTDGFCETPSSPTLSFSEKDPVADVLMMDTDGVEVVSPILQSNGQWRTAMETFWATIDRSFKVRRDASMGFHIHLSPPSKKYTDDEVLQFAKAVTFWEPLIADLAPPSAREPFRRHCSSNIASREGADEQLRYILNGPVKKDGYSRLFDYMATLDRDELIKFVASSKRLAFNFKPAAEGGLGSIEFRRPPGVWNLRSTTHWISFAIGFWGLAMEFFGFGSRTAAPRATDVLSFNKF